MMVKLWQLHLNKKEKKLLTPNSPAEISFPENIMKPAIIIPVSASIIGVARIIMLPILIFFSTKSSITS